MITRPFKRLFAFGCSYTRYSWPMWPEIIKQEFGDQIEYYNLGCSGAGNEYIRHQLFSAHQEFSFNHDDLVMVCWSSAFRNDWFLESTRKWRKWNTEGNILFPGVYNSKLDTKLLDMNHYIIRDASLMTGASKFLETLESQTHQMSIINNFLIGDQDHGVVESEILEHPECKPLIEYLDTKMKPSYWEMGYHPDYYDDKLQSILPENRDGHPMPMDSLEYLTKVFDYEFSTDTVKVVEEWESKLWNIMVNRHGDLLPAQGLHEYLEINYPDLSRPF